MAKDRFPMVDRREFITRIGAVGATISMAMSGNNALFAYNSDAESIRLPSLPYANNALAPHISEKTISFHYGKHHQGYVNKTIKMIAGTEFETASIRSIVQRTATREDLAALFNNAAQVFNHTFYWKSMKPGGGGKPRGLIAERIDQSFGGYDQFVAEFSEAAATQFGSGWVWLIQERDGLKILQTSNADTPIAYGLNPIIAIDVWEHAYYLDYQNRRADYIKAFVGSLLDWDFAAQNLIDPELCKSMQRHMAQPILRS